MILPEGIDSGESQPASVWGGRTETGLELLKPLLASGAEFLMNLSKSIGQPASGEIQAALNPAGPRISQDPEAGESFLKITLPETETIQKILSALTGVMMNFQTNSLSKSGKGSN